MNPGISGASLAVNATVTHDPNVTTFWLCHVDFALAWTDSSNVNPKTGGNGFTFSYSKTFVDRVDVNPQKTFINQFLNEEEQTLENVASARLGATLADLAAMPLTISYSTDFA